MTKGSRRPLLAALALASLTTLAGCDEHVVESIFLALIVLVFAVIGTLTSIVGIAVAAVEMVQRRRGSPLNLGVAIPFAILAGALIVLVIRDHAGVRPGFLVFLLTLTGTPFLWLLAAILSLTATPRPPEHLRPEAPQSEARQPGEAPPPRPRPAVGNVVMIVAPLVIAVGVCGGMFGFCVRPGSHRSPSPEPDPSAIASAFDERIRAMREASSPFGPPPKLAKGQVFEPMWSASIGRWNSDVSFAPSGEIVAVDSTKLWLLDAATGHTLGEAASCSSVTGGFGWLDARRAALVCSDVVRAYELPALRPTPLVQRKTWKLAGGAVHPKLIIASDADEILAKKARVRLFDPSTRARLAELAIPADDVKGVAIAPDGVLFALGFDEKIELREAPSGQLLRDIPTGGNASQALSFSADGKLLFADAGSFEAGVFDVATLRRLRSYRIGSWLSASRWLPDGSVVATGSDGLAAFFPDGSQASTLDHLALEGLAVSSDGTRVCAGDRNGTVRMFRIVPPPSR